MSKHKDLCVEIRYHILAMGPPDGDASWYKDNASCIDEILKDVKLLIDLVDPQEESNEGN
jgi:hypothetical protein